MNNDSDLVNRLAYLNKKVNKLTIECLAQGFIPKIKTGQEITKENLILLRGEIQQLIGDYELKRSGNNEKKINKNPNIHKKSPKSSENDEESNESDKQE